MPANMPSSNPSGLPKGDIVTSLENKGAKWAVDKYVRPYLTHWKTTIAGVAVIVHVLYDVANGGDFDLKQFLAGIGLVMAKDAVVTAEPVSQ